MRSVNCIKDYALGRARLFEKQILTDRPDPLAGLTQEELSLGQELLNQDPNETLTAENGPLFQTMVNMDAEPILTAEEGKKLNTLLKKDLQDYMKQRPRVSPEKIVNLYQQFVPSFTLIPPAEQNERELRRSKAAASYSQALVNAYGYIEGSTDYTRDRAEQVPSRLFSPEDMAAYRGFCKDNNEVEISKLFVKTIEDTLKKYGDILSGPISDDQLVEQYPNLFIPIVLMMEGVNLINKAEKNGAITPEHYHVLHDKVEEVLKYTPMLQQRMALLSDPYYSAVRLESLLECSPAELSDYETDQEDICQELGIKIKEDPLPKNDVPFEQAIATEKKDLKKNNTILNSDNVLSLGWEIYMYRSEAYEAAIAKELGMTVAEMQNTMKYCNKNGDTFTVLANKPEQLLKDNDNEIYIMSMDGGSAPIPITVDPTKTKYTILVGEEKIRSVSLNADLRKPRLGFFGAIGNWLSTVFRKRPSEAMLKHTEARKKYDASVKLNDLQKRLNTPDRSSQDKMPNKEKSLKADSKSQQPAEVDLTNPDAARFSKFTRHLEDLRHKPGYEHVVPAAIDVMKNGSPESKRRLVLVHDDNLRKFDLLLKKGDPDALQKGLDAFVERENSPEIQQSKAMELSSSDQPETSKLEAPQAEHSMIQGPINA